MSAQPNSNVKPLCKLFGQCGGCQFQDIAYADELKLKEQLVGDLFDKSFGQMDKILQPILPSPKEYHYRHRLDLKLVNSIKNGLQMGFSPETGKQILPAQECPIARQEISDFLPQLKEHLLTHWPQDYEVANVVVRSGDARYVRWGGIGQRSLRMNPEEYFWTEVRGQKIYYSLETFFQANLDILPAVIDYVRSFDFWQRRPVFLDLYAGVGLFGLSVVDLANKVFMIEENKVSARLAQHNVAAQRLAGVLILARTVEAALPEIFKQYPHQEMVAMIDPPRAGLSPQVVDFLKNCEQLSHLIYLSCQPESLVRDLKILTSGAWRLREVRPLDFFPKTRHIETLVVLEHLKKG